jgi:Fe-Mn family superoxide dismutase
MSPRGGGRPEGELARAIERAFGGFDELKKRFGASATGIFGSGWAWLVRDADGKLSILETPNAENPLTRGLTPVLTCDVWEHAYYLDRKNDREAYVEAWWNVVDWSFAEKNLGAAAGAVRASG